MPAKFSISSIYKAVDKFTAPLKRMEQASMRFASKTETGFARAERGARRLNKPVDMLAKKFGRIAALVGGISLGMAFYQGAQAVVDLDKNISAAAAKFQIFDRESDVFKRVRDKAIELGATTEFTSAQAAEALNNMAAAGFNVEQSMAGIATVLDLATASQSELATASLIAGKALGAFGLKSDNPKIMAQNLEMVSNVLNKLKSGKEFQSLEEILVTITGSGAAAKLAGQDINTWAAIVGSSIGAIGDASKVGTQLNMALTRLAKPTGEAAKLIKNLGIKVDDGHGNFRDFLDIIGDVNKATKQMGSRQKAAALSTIFGARSYKVISVLLDQGADKLKAYRDEIKSADKITQKMASFMRTGLSGALAAMRSAFEAIAIAIGDTFQPEIDAAIKSLTKIARGTKDWLNANKALIKFVFKAIKVLIWYVVIVKGISLAIKIAKALSIAYNIVLGIQAALFGTLTKGIVLNKAALIAYSVTIKIVSALMVAWTAITGALKAVWLALNAAFIATPIGLIITGILLLIVAIVLLIKKWDKVKAKIDEFSNSAVFQILSIVFPLLKILELIAFMQDRWNGIKNAFKSGGFLAGLKAIGKAILSFLLKPIEILLKLIGKIPGMKFAARGAEKIQTFRGRLDEDLVEKREPETIEKINIVKAQNEVQNERYEEIKRNQLEIELTNRTDKDVGIKSNPAFIPILTNTQMP